MVRNPKQDGSVLYDCIPQVGPCPNQCHECFYNRAGAFYLDIAHPHVPAPETLPAGAIVRMNSGHDSNLQRELVVRTAAQYDQVFFNTSLPTFDFPGPFVLTVNPKEEEVYHRPPTARMPKSLMFVRVRVSPSNRRLAQDAIWSWTSNGIPTVLTFMRYYDMPVPENKWPAVKTPYVFKQHILNSYWCPTAAYTRAVMGVFADNPLVSMCGGHEGGLCKTCRNCETYYLQSAKRLRGE